MIYPQTLKKGGIINEYGDISIMTDAGQNVYRKYDVPDKYRIGKVLSIVKSYFGGRKGSVLELGICDDSVAELLSNDGWKCFGVDINSRKIKNVEIMRADLNVKFSHNKKFDLIFAGEIVEHIFNDRKFIKEIHDHLEPRGLFVLTTPNLHYSLNRIRILFGMESDTFAHCHYHTYSIKEMKSILKRAGFSRIYRVSSTHVLISSVRFGWLGTFFEWLGGIFPSFGRNMIIAAVK